MAILRTQHPSALWNHPNQKPRLVNSRSPAYQFLNPNFSPFRQIRPDASRTSIAPLLIRRRNLFSLPQLFKIYA
jgi:hypothetical protein